MHQSQTYNVTTSNFIVPEMTMQTDNYNFLHC